MDIGPNAKAKLTIGRLARAGGVSVTTVRYYQRRGLIRLPEKPPSGSFRSYGERDLERLLLIRQTQELGFTLSEIAVLIRHIEERNCQAVLTLVDRKRQDVARQIATLTAMRKALERLAESCLAESCEPCRLFEQA